MSETSCNNSPLQCQFQLLVLFSMQDKLCNVFHLASTCPNYRTVTDTLSSRLPVRGLFFQCTVCTHGGHQSCYRRYLQRPMTALPDPLMSPLDARGRSSDLDTNRFGHPCAAGCGDFCWMSSSTDNPIRQYNRLDSMLNVD